MWRAPVSLVVAAAGVGFGFVAAAGAFDEARETSEPRRVQLLELIEARTAEIDRLGRDMGALRRDVGAVEERSSESARAVSETRRRASVLAGLVAMEGRGVVVRMHDSEFAERSPATRRALRVLDVDLQLVVNALWQAGAEAVSVNGLRVIALTSIRGAGETITVNFQPIASPYEVRAIGADADRFRASSVTERLESWVELFGFGFEVHERSSVEVPAYAGSLRTVSARSVPTPDGSGGG